MRIRRAVAAVAVGGAMIVGAFALATPADAAVRPATTSGHFTGDGIRIHQYPDTASATLGLGYSGDSVTVECATTDDYFYYVDDNTTGVSGYASTQYVQPDPGSVGICV